MIAAGQDLDWIDAQGATLVKRWAALVWARGSGPEPRPSRAEVGQHLREAKPIQLGPVRGFGPPPAPLGARVAPGT